MKPNSTNNLSFLGYIGLFILFNLPYIGTPAMIICAFFGSGGVKKFARVLLIITVICLGILIALSLLGFINIEQFIPATQDNVEAVLGFTGNLI